MIPETLLSSLPLPSMNQFLIQVVAMALTALALPRLQITSIFGPILMVLALGAINVFYWDQNLFSVIPDALNLKIVGLFAVNGIMFWILVKLLPGIEVKGILPALAAPIVFSILSIVIEKYAPLVPWTDIFNFIFTTLGQIKAYFEGSTQPA